jgi:hypothetical protein
MKNGELMALGGIFQKMKENLFFIAAEKLDTLAKDKSLMDSFQYFLVLMVITMPFHIIISIIGKGEIASVIIGSIIGLIIGIPLFYLVISILFALLKLMGGTADLSRTIQVFIYGGTCGAIFGWIPVISFFTSLISLSNIVLGIARVHQIQLWKSILVIVVFPIIILIILAIIASVAMVSLLPGGIRP